MTTHCNDATTFNDTDRCDARAPEGAHAREKLEADLNPAHLDHAAEIILSARSMS